MLARPADRQWEMSGRKFFRIDCSGPLIADGIAYVDRNHFASFAESTGLWLYKIAEGSWPVMVIEAVSTPKSGA